MSTENKKILLIGLYYFENLGDPLYMLTTKKLLEKNYNCIVDIADIYGRTEMPRNAQQVRCVNEDKSVLSKIKRVRIVRVLSKTYHRFTRQKKLRLMYSKMIEGYDAVVIPGGGVVSLKAYPFHEYFSSIQKECKKKKIVFCMNAVGTTSIYGKKLLHINKWQKIIDSPAMSYFSLRDGVENFSKICNRKINKTICTGILCSELFEIKKITDSNTIGIGVIKGDIFVSNGIDFSEEQLVNLYVDVIKQIQKRGYKTKIFTNGFKEDARIADIIKTKLNDDSVILIQANTPKELVSQISSFKAIVCARMHSAIIASSLNVPAILFSWGTKCQSFMRDVGAEENVIKVEDLNVSNVMKRFDNLLTFGWKEKHVKRAKQLSIDSVNDMWNIINNG